MRPFMPISRIIFLCSIACLVILAPLLQTMSHSSEAIASAQTLPLVDFSALSMIPIQASAPATAASRPVRLIIPSIGLDDPIEGVGVDKNGDMAVPSGKTSNVGWYDKGTIPGQIGSAVIDAHVFAAFAQLKQLPIGADIYVQTESGATLHFVAEEADTYPLAEVPVRRLFTGNDAARLNLITCAGRLIDNNTTYDHRLIVYAVLVS